MARIIVLDTSFLLELFGVPMDSTPEKNASAIALFEDALENNYDIFCPVSVLYELANHIVDVSHAEIQRRLALSFKAMVESSFTESVPFAIIPNGDTSPAFKELLGLPELCQMYHDSIRQGLGLTDCTIIDVAHSLKRNYTARHKPWPTYIWTTHEQLRALAPDATGHEYF